MVGSFRSASGLRRRVTRRFAVVVCIGLATASSAWPAVADEGDDRGVSWAGQYFSSRQELTEWLERRGLSYEDWAARHPRAASRFDPVVGEPGTAPRALDLPRTLRYVVFTALGVAVVVLALAAFPPGARIERARVGLGVFGLVTLLAFALALVLVV